MSISPQSLARTRDKRSHKIPARFNDTVYNEAHYVEATQTQVLRTSTRSRPSSAGLKRDLDEEETDEEEVPKPTKSSNRSSSHSKRSNKTISNETSPGAADTNTRTAEPIVTAPTTTKAAAIISFTETIARPAAAQTWKPPSTPSSSATPSLTSEKSATKLSKSSSSKSKKKSSPTKDKINATSLIFKKPPTSARKPNDVKKAAAPQLAPKIMGASNNNLTAPNTPHHNNPSVGPKTFATPISLLPGSPSQATTNYINQGIRHFNGLTPNHQHYGTRMMINEQVYLPRSVGTIAPITTSLAQISNQARRPPFVSKKAQACLDYQDRRKLNHITSTFHALIRIAQNLGLSDRLSLRAVSKTWKLVVDSNYVWKKVILDNADSKISDDCLIEKLVKLKIEEIHFNEYEGDASEFISMKSYCEPLKIIKFKSVTPEQNHAALGIMYYLVRKRMTDALLPATPSDDPLVVEWDVKVGVDALGIATVKFPGNYMKYLRYRSFEAGKLVVEDEEEEEEGSATGGSKSFRLEFHDLKKGIFGPKSDRAQNIVKLVIRAI